MDPKEDFDTGISGFFDYVHSNAIYAVLFWGAIVLVLVSVHGGK